MVLKVNSKYTFQVKINMYLIKNYEYIITHLWHNMFGQHRKLWAYQNCQKKQSFYLIYFLKMYILVFKFFAVIILIKTLKPIGLNEVLISLQIFDST